MATRKTRTPDDPRPASSQAAVSALMLALEHPLEAEIAAVRQIVLGVDPRIEEAVKWNAPSFRTTEFFATVHLRSRDSVQLVFHTGAKARDLPGGAVRLDVPSDLVRWLGKDRCLVTLGTAAEIDARRPAFESLIRQWIDQL
ncbi:MAG: DUF1801 domain-containing protein [Pseudomonadota bacterium]|nr:DUF1801 domain-containing protein [Pseudomonadota bacterium]